MNNKKLAVLLLIAAVACFAFYGYTKIHKTPTSEKAEPVKVRPAETEQEDEQVSELEGIRTNDLSGNVYIYADGEDYTAYKFSNDNVVITTSKKGKTEEKVVPYSVTDTEITFSDNGKKETMPYSIESNGLKLGDTLYAPVATEDLEEESEDITWEDIRRQ